MEIKNILHNLHLRDRLDIQFTACSGELMPEEALHDVIYHII